MPRQTVADNFLNSGKYHLKPYPRYMYKTASDTNANKSGYLSTSGENLLKATGDT